MPTNYASNQQQRRDVSPAHNEAEKPRPGRHPEDYRSVSPLLQRKAKPTQVPVIAANFENQAEYPGSWSEVPEKM